MDFHKTFNSSFTSTPPYPTNTPPPRNIFVFGFSQKLQFSVRTPTPKHFFRIFTKTSVLRSHPPNLISPPIPNIATNQPPPPLPNPTRPDAPTPPPRKHFFWLFTKTSILRSHPTPLPPPKFFEDFHKNFNSPFTSNLTPPPKPDPPTRRTPLTTSNLHSHSP